MPNYSDSVENLRQFIARVLEPNIEKMQKANPEMDNHAAVLDQLDDEFVGTGNMFDAELESVGTGIAADVDMAIGGIGDLEKAAQAGARDGLPDAGAQLDAGGDDFVKAANAVDQDLDAAGTALDSSGFQDVVKDLAAAEADLGEAATEVASAFDSVAQGAASLATELASGLQDAASNAGGAAGALDAHAKEIESEGQATIGAVSAACSDVAGAYDEMKGELEEFYEGIKGKATSEGESFKDCVRKLLEAQNEEARSSIVDPLTGPIDFLIDDVLEPHRQELGQWVQTVEKADTAAEGLKSLVSDLKRAKRAAEEIEKLGEAVGG
jgi:hypothetical protein